MRYGTFIKAIAATATLALLLSRPGFAASHGDHDHEAHTGIYKDRADTMKSFGAVAKETGAMFKGEIPFDLAKIKAGGKMIADKAPTIPKLFPEGTNEGESEALAIIWTDWEGFKAAASLLATRAGVLASAEDPQSAGAAFGDMAKACGGCHEKYRLKKEEK